MPSETLTIFLTVFYFDSKSSKSIEAGLPRFFYFHSQILI